MLAFATPRIDLGRYRTALLVAGVVLGVALLLALADVAASWGKVHPGVTVGGVAVGGKGVSETRAILERELGPRLKLLERLGREHEVVLTPFDGVLGEDLRGDAQQSWLERAPRQVPARFV